MSWISHSLPPEADDPPQAPVEAPAPTIDLGTQRAELAAKVRRGIRSHHQDRILRQIADLTRQILSQR